MSRLKTGFALRAPSFLLVLLLNCFVFLFGLSVASASEVLVKADTLTLREKPGPNEKRLDNLVKFDLVSIVKTQTDWAQVSTKDGKSGWVLTKYLTPTPFVTVDIDQMNVRRGPAETYDVIMKFTHHYPLRVQDRAEGWLKIADYEGDRGWVSVKNVTLDPYVITKTAQCKIRGGPGTESPVAFTTEKGVVLQVTEEKNGWVKVKHHDGDEGWISEKTVFGWLESDGAEKDKNAEQAKAKDSKDQAKSKEKSTPTPAPATKKTPPPAKPKAPKK